MESKKKPIKDRTYSIYHKCKIVRDDCLAKMEGRPGRKKDTTLWHVIPPKTIYSFPARSYTEARNLAVKIDSMGKLSKTNLPKNVTPLPLWPDLWPKTRDSMGQRAFLNMIQGLIPLNLYKEWSRSAKGKKLIAEDEKQIKAESEESQRKFLIRERTRYSKIKKGK